MAKIIMGDPCLEGRADEIVMMRDYGRVAVTRRELVAEAAGVYGAALGQPAARSNCKNCGAPHEPVCSYCGSRS